LFREGEHFASGGEDKVVKLWGYDEGLCNYVGVGHSGAITKVSFLFYKMLNNIFVVDLFTWSKDFNFCWWRRCSLYLEEPWRGSKS